MCGKCIHKASAFNISDEEGYVYSVSNEIANYARARYEPGTLEFFNLIGSELDKWKSNPLRAVNKRFQKIGHVNTMRG